MTRLHRLLPTDTVQLTRWLALLIFIALFAGIGLRGPWPPDEPRFALVAKDMVETGQWLFPMRGGELYADKPPLFMWAIAASYAVVGDIQWAFLIPSLLAGLGTLWLVYDLTRRLTDAATARFAAALLFVCPQLLIQAKFAQIDMWLTFFVTLGCYGFVRSLYLKQGQQWFWLSFVAMGLGIISKGVGFLPLFLLLALGVWRLRFATQLQSWQSVTTGKFLLGLLILLLTVSLWLLPMLLTVFQSLDPQFVAYRDNILLKQTAGRYADPWHHFQPWHYYLSSVIPAFWLPVLLLWLARWREIGTFVKQPLVRVLLTYVGLVVLFFSISPAKRGVYILPALPMLVVVTAMFYQGHSLRGWLGKLQTGIIALLSSLLIIAAFLLAFGHGKLAERLSHLSLLLEYRYAIAAGLALTALGLLVWMRLPWQRGERWFVSMVWLATLLPLLSYPLLQPERSPTAEMAKARQLAGANAPIAMLDFKEQHMLYANYPVWHYGYHVDDAETEQRAYVWLERHPDGAIVVPEKFPLQCFSQEQAEVLGQAHRQTLLLLTAKNKRSHCPAPQEAHWFVTGQAPDS